MIDADDKGARGGGKRQCLKRVVCPAGGRRFRGLSGQTQSKWIKPNHTRSWGSGWLSIISGPGGFISGDSECMRVNPSAYDHFFVLMKVSREAENPAASYLMAY